MTDDELEELKAYLESLSEFARGLLDPQSMYGDMGLDVEFADPVDWDEVARHRQRAAIEREFQAKVAAMKADGSYEQWVRNAWAEMQAEAKHDRELLSLLLPLLRETKDRPPDELDPDGEAIFAGIVQNLVEHARRVLRTLPMPAHHREETEGDLPTEVMKALRRSPEATWQAVPKEEMLSLDERGRPLFGVAKLPDSAALAKLAAANAKKEQRKRQRRESIEIPAREPQAAPTVILDSLRNADPEVVELMLKHPDETRAEWAERLGVNPRTLRKRLEALRTAVVSRRAR